MGNFSKNPQAALAEAIAKGYTGVLLEQSAPLLDRDVNLLAALLEHPLRTIIKHHIGNVPAGSDGFRISNVNLAANDFTIGAGTILANGLVITLETATTFQEHTGHTGTLPAGQSHVYLRVWEEEWDSTHDPDLENPDDVGMRTSVRRKQNWEVLVSQNRILTDDHVLLAMIHPSPGGPGATVTDERVTGLTLQSLSHAIRISAGEVGIGTERAAARLHIRGVAPDANNAQVVITEMGGKFMLLGRASSYGFVQSHNREPLAINPIGNNVGIGTTDPQSRLHIAVGTSQNEAASPRISGRFPSLSFYDETANAEDRNWTIGGAWHRNGDFVISQSNAPNGDPRNAGTARLYFNPTGNVGIGTTNPSYKLDVEGKVRADNVSDSDARMKENVKTLEGALEKVTHLRGVSFEWKDPQKDSGTQIGMIAQEVEQVLPELVSTDQEGYKSLAYSKLTCVLIEAVKELKAENDELRKRIAALERA